jgi:hypothetical protein
MKSILDRLWRRSAAAFEQSASGPAPNTVGAIQQPDIQQMESVPIAEAQSSPSHHTEPAFDPKQEQLGLGYSLKDIPGVTEQILVAFSEHGIMSY